MYEKSEQITKTISHVNEYINNTKIDIIPYTEMFDKSWKNKQNIYIL